MLWIHQKPTLSLIRRKLRSSRCPGAIAPEKIFCPMLAVIKVSFFDEALEVANGTDFALTGGIYPRTPLSIERATEEFEVGNFVH